MLDYWSYLEVVLSRAVSQMPGVKHAITYPIDQIADLLVYFQVPSTTPPVGSKPWGDGCEAYLSCCIEYVGLTTHGHD